jgi:hypothetical protein
MQSDGLAALRLLGERLMVDDDQAAGTTVGGYGPCRVLGGYRTAKVPEAMTK